jgi:hypothetical protein
VKVLDEQIITVNWVPTSGPVSKRVGQAGQLLDSWSGTVLQVGAITVTKEAKEVYSYQYEKGKTYKGKAEVCTAKVMVPFPDQLFAASWEVNKIASTFEEQVKQQGADMLEIKIFQDSTPTLETDFYVVATITSVPAALIPFPFPWAVVMVLVLAIILIVSFTFLIGQVKTIDWGQPGAAIGVGFAIAAVLAGLALVGVSASRKKKT